MVLMAIFDGRLVIVKRKLRSRHGKRKKHVQRIAIQALMIVGLVVSASAIATASPAIRLLDRGTTLRVSKIERVEFSWKHQNNNRAWDRRPGGRSRGH
jgi:hypothetical protein